MENIIEVLLSLRVHALQISPELRRHLVTELIKSDIFFITNGAPNIARRANYSVEPRDKFLLDLLDIQSSGLRHAICALVSVLASTAKGVDYLTQCGMQIVERVVRILKGEVPPMPTENGASAASSTEDGSVTQRFCIAIL